MAVQLQLQMQHILWGKPLQGCTLDKERMSLLSAWIQALDYEFNSQGV